MVGEGFLQSKKKDDLNDFWDGRCESCKYFRATVFKEESPTGLGVWFGFCIIKPSERHGWLSCKRVLNVYHKCEDYEKREAKSLEGKKNDVETTLENLSRERREGES